MKIIDNSKVSLIYHEAERIMHHQIHEPLSDEELKDMLLKGCEIFESTGAQKWLSDDRGNGPVSEEVERWGKEVWNKRMLKAGWKHWALVLPKEIMKSSNLQVIIFNFSKLGVTTRLFHNPDTALKWLKTQ